MQNTIDEIKKREYVSNFVAVKNIKRKLKTLLKDEEYLSMENYIQHGTTNCILHSIAVTHYSLMFASKLHIKINYNSLVRGALLHDYFLYDWHEKDDSHKLHGFRHPGFALKNALKRWNLNEIEKDVIKKHMFPLTLFLVPKYKESIIVCLVDKVCATYETFVKKEPYKRLKLMYKL